MKFVVEPGDFEIMVGNSSRDSDVQKIILAVQ
jgi:beta-glucosidase